jgi:hypothetical protein
MNYVDMLGRPYSEVHCGQAVAEGLRRLGMADAARTVPESDQEAAERVSELRLEDPGSWERIGDETHQASREGDIVMLRRPGGKTGIALFLGDDLFLTSTMAQGVVATPSRRLPRGCLGVYRWGAS